MGCKPQSSGWLFPARDEGESSVRPSAPPEEAVVDATLFDPLGAATLLSAFASRGSAPVRSGLLADIARKENLPTQRLQPLLAALCASGLVSAGAEGFVLVVDGEE